MIHAPFCGADGHDVPRPIDELVPRLAAVVANVVVGGEDAVPVLDDDPGRLRSFVSRRRRRVSALQARNFRTWPEQRPCSAVLQRMEQSSTVVTSPYGQLVHAVLDRRCILFASAGVPMAVGLPSWGCSTTLMKAPPTCPVRPLPHQQIEKLQMDFATRAWNHSFPFDPIVRSLLDNDFYKLLMQQFIWENYLNEHLTWKVTNRTKSIRLGEQIEAAELREQLDHARSLRLTASEIIHLRGQTFYGQSGIFKEGYLHSLQGFQLPEYELGTDRDGQLTLRFAGPWWETTMWEIPALAIVNELRSRQILRGMSRSALDILYARAKVKLYAKLERLRELPDLNLSDFGTRRRHGFLWQEHCILTAAEVLGDGFTGTSNVHLAMKHGMEAKGTNAHELPMVVAALARKNMPNDAEALRGSQYEVLRRWQNEYQGNLLVFLPDTFGTTQFLREAPHWVSYWTGARPDSKDAMEAGEELLTFWRRMGLTAEAIASNKLIIFSDGLDVRIPGFEANGTDIPELYHRFYGRAQVGFGWGTNLTNDFLGCHPSAPEAMRVPSLVCKVETVNGHPAIKLSDNYAKALGPDQEVAAYRRVFGTEGVRNVPVNV